MLMNLSEINGFVIWKHVFVSEFNCVSGKNWKFVIRGGWDMWSETVWETSISSENAMKKPNKERKNPE